MSGQASNKVTTSNRFALRSCIGLAVLAMLADERAMLAASVTHPAGSFSVTPPAGSGSWNNPSFTMGNADSFCGTTLAGTIKLSGYGFTVPANATVTGVTVSLTVSSPENSLDTQLVLVTSAASSAARSFNAANSVSFPNCGGPLSSGADGDLWGFTSPALTAADVNDADFGLRITGTGNEGLGPWRLDAGQVTIHYLPPPPAAPSNLVAASAQNQVNLTWTDNSTDESAFYVDRALDEPSPTFLEIGVTAANATTLVDGNAACNTAYLYRVRAFRGGDLVSSGYSNASVTHVCPDFTVTKSAAPPVVLTDQPWTWTLVIDNGGSGPATFTPGLKLLNDELPGGAGYSNVTLTPGAGVTGAVSCGLAGSVLSCTATSEVVLPAAASVTVTVDGVALLAAELTNGGDASCTAEPGGLLEETIEANNACNASTVSVRFNGVFADGFEDGVLPGPWSGGSFP